MKNTTDVTLTPKQKLIQPRMLALAKKLNANGKGYVLGDGYNQSWHKVRDALIAKGTLVSKKSKKGLWVK
jgi:hypothetical protein